MLGCESTITGSNVKVHYLMSDDNYKHIRISIKSLAQPTPAINLARLSWSRAVHRDQVITPKHYKCAPNVLPRVLQSYCIDTQHLETELAY